MNRQFAAGSGETAAAVQADGWTGFTIGDMTQMSEHCPVCLRLLPMRKLVRLQCGHGLCGGCGATASSFGHEACPVCRQPHELDTAKLGGNLNDFRRSYTAWRQGGTKGAHGELLNVVLPNSRRASVEVLLCSAGIIFAPTTTRSVEPAQKPGVQPTPPCLEAATCYSQKERETKSAQLELPGLHDVLVHHMSPHLDWTSLGRMEQVSSDIGRLGAQCRVWLRQNRPPILASCFGAWASHTKMVKAFHARQARWLRKI